MCLLTAVPEVLLRPPQTFLQSGPSDVIWGDPLQTHKVLKTRCLQPSISHNQHVGQGEPKVEEPRCHGNHKEGGRSSRKGLQLLPVQVSKQFQVIMSLSEEFEWKRKAIFGGNISPVCPPFRTSCFVRTESKTWGLFLVLPTDSWVTSVTSSLRVFRVPLSEKNFKISFQPEL